MPVPMLVARRRDTECHLLTDKVQKVLADRGLPLPEPLISDDLQCGHRTGGLTSHNPFNG